MDDAVTNESFKDVVASRFDKFKSEVLSERMVGFALSRTWVYLVFFNGALILDPSRAGQTLDLVYLGSLVTLVALLATCGVACRAADALSGSLYGRAAPAILSILGTSALPFAGLNEYAGMAAIAFAAIATGAGSGLFVLFWGKVYARVGGSVTIGDATAAFVLASLPVPLFLLLPFAAQIAIVTLLPIGSAWALSRELDRMEAEDGCPDENAPAQEGAANGTDASGRPKRPERPEEAAASWSLETVNLSWKKILAKLIASSLVFGCVISLMRTTSAGQGIGALNDELNDVLPLISLVVGAITLMLLLFSRQLDLAYSYKPVLILMMVGCILMPFSGIWNLGNLPAHAAAMAGYIGFEIMNWTILSDISFRFNIPACHVYGFGRAATSGGVLFGAVLGVYLNFHIAYTTELLSALAFALVFALVVTYTFTLTERDVAKITRRRARHPFLEDVDGVKRHELTLEDKVDILADRHGIVGRGREVLMLLAKGNSAARIEQELYMSKGTVNTHTRRLYQKLGVHKRQELIDLVNSVEGDVDDL